MGLYVDNPHAPCEKTHQLRRFCSLPSRAEEGMSIQLKSSSLKGLTCYDYLSTSAPEMPVSSSMASVFHQGYVDDESTAFNGSSGSLSPSSDSYDLQGHELPLPSQEGKQEPSYGLLDENDAPVDVHACDEFRMFEFKVRRCMRGRSHDWTECPFAHPGEKARRRDPRRYHYSGTACPDFRKGTCRRGDACEYAHGVFECWLHPARYRTQPCKDGRSCRRRVCFFAHTQEQMRLLPAAAAAASLTTIRSTATSHPLKPTLQYPQPSAASFMSPQPSPASTPSLVSAFISPCSTPGVQGAPVQTARNGYSTTSAGLSLGISQTPPLSPPPSPSYSPPHSPQQGSPNKMQAMYQTHGFHVDGSDSAEVSQGSLGRSHFISNMQSMIGSQPQGSTAVEPTGIQQHSRGMMAGTGTGLSLSDLAALYHSTAQHQQPTPNTSAMANLLNSFSAMNLHTSSPFWLQAQMALAAAHMQAQVEEQQQQQHAHMHTAENQLPQIPQMNLPVPVTSSSPGHTAGMPPAPQHAGLSASPPRRSLVVGLPSPVSRVEKWMGENPVVEDLDSAGEQPFVESGRSLRAEVFTKLLKRDESHSSLCGHADLEWVSDLVRDDKNSETMSAPSWDLWSHSWLNSHFAS